MMFRRLLLLALVCVPGLPAAAQACSVSAPALSFPDYNAFSGTQVTTTSTVSVTCTGLLFLGVSYAVQLDGGQSGNIMSRRMDQAVSSDELGYQVRLNSHTGSVWGNGVQGSTMTGTMALGLFSRTNTRTVYGQVPAGQLVNSGNYADAPVMTIIY